jgi:hypothetical protein
VVDKDQILALLQEHFSIGGKVTIDEQGLVSCTGSVRLQTHISHLPVQFLKVSGEFLCNENQLLNSLEGAPQEVSRDFSCSNNPQLASLAGAPRKVVGDFSCSNLPSLTSLEGAPQSVGRSFYCIRNSQLTSLEGASVTVGKDIWLSGNPLLSLESLPQITGTLFLSYRRDLPLLRCLLANKIVFWPVEKDKTVEDILNRYAGQGEAGAFACGAELAAAGYKENARW